MASRRSLLATVGGTASFLFCGCQEISGNRGEIGTTGHPTRRDTGGRNQATHQTDVSAPTETTGEQTDSIQTHTYPEEIPYRIIGYEGRLLSQAEESSKSVSIVASPSDADELNFQDAEWVWRGENLTTADLEQFVEGTEFGREYILMIHRQVSGSDARLIVRNIDRMTESHVRVDISVTEGSLTNRPRKTLMVQIPVGTASAPQSATVYFSTPYGDDVAGT